MSNLRKFKIFSVIICLSFVLLQFQNCGSPPENYNGDISTSSLPNPGLIDDLPNQKIAFVESLVLSKHDGELVNYDGLCSKDSNGKNIEWELVRIEDEEVTLTGQSQCIRGGFRISINKMLDIECNVDYELSPFMGEFVDDVIIRRKCEPLKSVKIKSDKIQSTIYNPNIAVKECFHELEYRDEQLKSKDCYKSCYMSNKLYSRSKVEIDYCPE